MIKELLITLVLILAFPAGFLLAWLCKEELVPGRKWFLAIGIISLISGAIFLFFNLVSSLTSFFIAIISFVSLIKGYDKKFVKS